MSQQVRVASGLNIILGAWLIIAPFVLAFSDMVALWDSIIVGAVVLILAWIRMANPMSAPGISWVNAILGIWLIVAPFVLGFTAMAGSMWNNIIVGVVVAVLGAWSALATPAKTT